MCVNYGLGMDASHLASSDLLDMFTRVPHWFPHRNPGESRDVAGPQACPPFHRPRATGSFRDREALWLWR